MNKKKKNIYIGIALGCILLVATLFRFYKLSNIPPSLNWDEVAFGYNAHSLLKTGKDEFGTSFPLYFRSLDDYKLPVYMYATVGSIALFGYNDFAVRFPSAFFGSLTVLLVYFLVKGLFLLSFRPPSRNLKMPNSSFAKASADRQVRHDIDDIMPLLSSLLLAILPWHIQFSRMAAEANAGLFFLTLGVTLFLYGIHTYYWLSPLSIIAFGLAAYSYLSFRIVAACIGLILVFLYWKDIRLIQKKILVITGISVACIAGFLLWDMLFHNVHVRVQGTSVFGTQQAFDIFKHKEQEMFYDATLKINLTRRLFHDNPVFTTADVMVRGYLTHFSPIFLFFDYDEKQHHTPFVGLLFIWMLPFILLGLYYVIQHVRKREATLIVLWLLIAPIPASITWDIPHAIRVFGMSIPLVILIACGVYSLVNFLYKKKFIFGLIASSTIVFLIGLSSYYYAHQYILHLPQERSQDWVYGRKEMTEYLEKNKSKYDRIIVSSSLEWPYIFMLYYSRYDPARYLLQGGTISGGWGEDKNSYDLYEFHTFRKEDMRANHTLFVGKPEEFDKDIIPMKIVYYVDGEPAIYIAEGNIKIQ